MMNDIKRTTPGMLTSEGSLNPIENATKFTLEHLYFTIGFRKCQERSNFVMKLDKTFEKEIIKISNGNGSREAKFNFLKSAKETAKELSTIKAAEIFNSTIKKHGRVTVAICVAATILQKEDRLDYPTCQWARKVISLWGNRPSDISCVAFCDGLHPTRIEEYAGGFIRLTTEENA